MAKAGGKQECVGSEVASRVSVQLEKEMEEKRLRASQ